MTQCPLDYISAHGVMGTIKPRWTHPVFDQIGDVLPGLISDEAKDAIAADEPWRSNLEFQCEMIAVIMLCPYPVFEHRREEWRRQICFKGFDYQKCRDRELAAEFEIEPEVLEIRVILEPWALELQNFMLRRMAAILGVKNND